MPPPSSASRSTANGHVVVVHADDDDVVRVVRDGRGERAALRARSRETKPSPIRPVAEVALDDGDLREVALGVGDRVPVLDERLAHERLGHDLVRDEPDHAQRSPPLHGIAKSAGATRRDAHGLSHPLGHLDARDRPRSGGPRFSTISGAKRLEVGQDEQVGLSSRARSRRGGAGRARAPG